MLFSCVQDEIPAGTNPNSEKVDYYTKILMNLPDLQSANMSDLSTKSMDDKAERMVQLSKLNILVFKVTSGVETYAYKAPISGNIEYDTQDGTKAMITVKLEKSQSGAQYRMVLIANQDISSMTLTAGTTLKEDVLQVLTYTVSGKWSADDANYTPFPMWGESDVLTVTDSMTSPMVNLYRALARIDVGINFVSDNGELNETTTGLDYFKLKVIKVYRTYNQGYVAPLNSSMNNYNQPYIPQNANRYEDNVPLSYQIAEDGGADQYIREIYIPEADVPNFPNNDNMHCLVIGGYYKGSSSMTYYRLDFATEDESTGSRTYLPVLRNYRYVFNINTVRGPGFTTPEVALQSNSTIENINYDLISWDEQMTALEVQGKYYFGLEQNSILLGPDSSQSSKAIFYQTNLPSDSTVILEWKKGDASPFKIHAHFVDSKRFVVTTKTENTTNQILTDTLFVKAGLFSMSILVEQQYVNFKYTLNCSFIKVFGTYTHGEALDASHRIRVQINAEDSTILGRKYVLETEDLGGDHGIRFSATGTFNSLTEIVLLSGSGTLNYDPEEGPFKLRIKTNSSSGSYCEATITPVDEPMNILVLGDINNLHGYSISRLNGGAGQVFNNKRNFGSDDNSIIKIGDINYITSYIYDFAPSISSEPYKWVTGIGNNGKIADLVYISYPAVFATLTAELLIDYLDKGGVLVAFVEDQGGSQFLAQHLFGFSNILAERLDATDGGAVGSVYPFPAHPSLKPDQEERNTVLREFEGDPILNGPFGDVRDKQWGEDASLTAALYNFPVSDPNVTIYSYRQNLSRITTFPSSDRVVAYKYESSQRNIVWFGDGGFMSSGYSGVDGINLVSNTICPFYWDTTTKFPVQKPVYGVTESSHWPVYNSATFCNVMAWAVKKSQSLKAKRDSYIGTIQ